jgi:hypothetical protein
MRKAIVLTSVLGIGAVCGLSAGTVMADSVSIGIQTDALSVGVNIGEPPKLVTVPGTTVYYAPTVAHNYFFYGGRYYLFHNGAWFFSAFHNGPWTVVALQSVPQPILTVPVGYYRVRPGHWKHKDGPPPWAAAKGHGKEKNKKKKWKHDD